MQSEQNSEFSRISANNSINLISNKKGSVKARRTALISLSETQKIGTMSKGMQEKLQLIMVMSRDAKLYMLDEPLGGVDPASRDYILDTIIKNYNEKLKVNVFISIQYKLRNFSQYK